MDIDWTNLLDAYGFLWVAILVSFFWRWFWDDEITDRNWRNLGENVMLAGLVGVVGLLFWVLTTYG